jgi:hypothetical protein
MRRRTGKRSRGRRSRGKARTRTFGCNRVKASFEVFDEGSLAGNLFEKAIVIRAGDWGSIGSSNSSSSSRTLSGGS